MKGNFLCYLFKLFTFRYFMIYFPFLCTNVNGGAVAQWYSACLACGRCSSSPSEETINRGPNTPIPTMHALICEELKDPGIPL